MANNVKESRGSAYFRLTVGADRVIFSIAGERLIVEAVQPRGKAYR
jgi:hypothetical protein|tara:strand:+ start:1458 stop:1595 length:138 start_codon:yes stop_codon:yes gene_type:complete